MFEQACIYVAQFYKAKAREAQVQAVYEVLKDLAVDWEAVRKDEACLDNVPPNFISSDPLPGENRGPSHGRVGPGRRGFRTRRSQYAVGVMSYIQLQAACGSPGSVVMFGQDHTQF